MIDWKRIRELKEEIGATDFAEVAGLFLDEMDAEMRALPAAQGDAAQMGDRLHSMKGSALNLGFSHVAALCADGEDRARAGDGCPVELGAVQKAFDRSKALFEKGRCRAETNGRD